MPPEGFPVSPPHSRYQVSINVRIYDRDMGGSGLSITEDATVMGGDFMELAGILGEFHKVFDKIKKAGTSDRSDAD